MPRFLLSAAAIFVLLFSVSAFPKKVLVRKCPVELPQTLLSLYLNSDAIFVARFEKTVTGENVREDNDYTIVEMNKYFSVSSSLKGKSQEKFVLEGEAFVEKSSPQEIVKRIGEPDELAPDELNAGDDVLLFLIADEDEKKLVLTDYSDGVKKLPAEHLKIYEARIKELNSIFAVGKVDHAKIVEWLVRCAENPATRWEGTFELLQSFRSLDWEEQEAKERKEKIENGETVEEEEEETETSEIGKDFESGATSVFAKLLTDYQKQVLLNLFFERENLSSDTEQTESSFVHGDEELIELTKRWGDSRLAVFLIKDLRSEILSSEEKTQMMTTIAGILKDKQLSALAEKFEEIYYQDDEREVEESDENTSHKSEEQPVQTENTENSEAVVSENIKETSTDTANTDKEKIEKLTYKQLREKILSEFLTRTEKVLAQEKAEVN